MENYDEVPFLGRPVQFNGGTPMTLTLGRAGINDVILKDNNDDVVYLIHETDRGSLSSKPDFEVYRTSANREMVGTIRFGKTSTEIEMTKTSAKSKGIEKVELNHVQSGFGGNFSWAVIKDRTQKVKLATIHSKEQLARTPAVQDEVVVLALVGGSYTEQSPACAVRIVGPSPKGFYEVYASEARVDQSGSWEALDELVVSAYANMESKNKELLKCKDTYWAHGNSRWVSIGQHIT